MNPETDICDNRIKTSRLEYKQKIEAGQKYTHAFPKCFNNIILDTVFFSLLCVCVFLIGAIE